MLLILIALLLALLPLLLTSALPQLVILSIYTGLAKLLLLACAMIIIAIIVRRRRIAEWRHARKLGKTAITG
jgi:hypothetical protein